MKIRSLSFAALIAVFCAVVYASGADPGGIALAAQSIDLSHAVPLFAIGMTVPAEGLFKVLSIGKQVAQGTPKVGAGCQKLRRTSAVFTATRDTTEHAEIVSHRQSTGVSYGLKKSDGKIDGTLSPATYSLLMAALLRADFAAVTPYAAGSDVTAQAAAPQFADASGGFLTAALKVGMVGRWTGFSGSPGSGNNARNFLITDLTATDMTGVFLDGGVAYADVAGDSVTFTVVGKVSKAATTAHTDDWFTVESWQSDISKSELFPDTKVSQIALSIPASGDATFSATMVGLGTRTLGTAQAHTSPAAETTTGVVEGVQGRVYVNGAVEQMTSCQITIDSGMTPSGAEIGSQVSAAMNQARLKVSGSFTGMYRNSTVSTLFDAETPIGITITSAVDGSATADFFSLIIGKVKITGDAPDDGEKVIMRTYPFTAEINGAGGAALAWDNTIISIQDSAA